LPKERDIREASRRNPPILEIKKRDSRVAIPGVASAERDEGEPSAFDEPADREAKILKKAHRDGSDTSRASKPYT
jgi:hypothetical protein